MTQQSLPQPPSELFELATGYQKSKTLFALVELGVPTLLAEKTVSLDEVAKQLHMHPRATDRLLNAGVALRLLERTAEGVRNTALTEQFLIKGKPTYLGDQFLNYNQNSYPAWADLTHKLQTWQPGETDADTPQEEDQGAESMRAQHNLAVMVGHALGQSYDFSQHRVMLDLGGGTAAMSLGICAVHPELRSIVFDLPAVAEVAREFASQSTARSRIEIRTGNFKEDALPHGYDVALLANLLSVASEETNRKLLKEIYNQLPQGGAVILSGWILDDTRTSPLIPVLFCLEDINWQVPDVERSASTYQSWLEEAGFVEIERRMYCPPTSMIIGRKSGS